TQLTLAIVGVVAVTAAAVGLFSYRSVETALLPGQLERAEMRVRLLAGDLQNYAGAARADVAAFRTTTIEGFIRASLAGGVDPQDSVTTIEQWRTQLVQRAIDGRQTGLWANPADRNRPQWPRTHPGRSLRPGRLHS
ncbi:MAG TPA: hypothetical protein VHX43_05335, partial [Xanthobacteraceae bacterium]|nr:hypothetical protein [Xanthobacteraceae bacterium]